MNISALTAKEVLRMCEPVTDLEKRLFDLVSELQDEINYYENSPAQNECDNCGVRLENIGDAIQLIESGKIDQGVKRLKGIS